MNKSMNQWMNQSINQSINQLINQLINQSFNQLHAVFVWYIIPSDYTIYLAIIYCNKHAKDNHIIIVE